MRTGVDNNWHVVLIFESWVKVHRCIPISARRRRSADGIELRGRLGSGSLAGGRGAGRHGGCVGVSQVVV